MNLLKSRSVVSHELMEGQPGLKYSRSYLQKAMNRQEMKNKEGIAHLDQRMPQLKGDMFRSSNSKVKVKVLNSQQKSDLFHFKVMQLRVHEDTKSSSSCKIRFHFFFELLRKRVKNELEIFDWNVNHSPKQRLYLSRNTMRLMEVINGTTAVVYQRKDVIDGETQAMESEKYHDGDEIDYG